MTRRIATTHYQRAGLIGAVALALLGQGGKALAQVPDPGPGWGLIDQTDQSFFLPARQVASSSCRTLASTSLMSARVVQMALATRDVRVTGPTRIVTRPFSRTVTTGIVEVPGPTHADRYATWVVQSGTETVRETPYSVYRQKTWKERVDRTFRNVYRIDTLYRWIDPLTHAPATASISVTDGPYAETVQGRPIDRQERTLINQGTLLSEPSVAIESTTPGRRRLSGDASLTPPRSHGE